MQPQTRRQKEVLEFITRYVENHGYKPSYELIARHLGVSSKGGVAKHIVSLENQGLLTRKRSGGSFNLELRASGAAEESVCRIEWLEVPKPQNSFVEDWEREPLFVPKFLLGFLAPERVNAFRAPNDSMLDKHICEGDIVLIERRSFARDGDIVVALTSGDVAVLKQFYRAGANVELRPANHLFEPIKLAANRVQILGVYHGLLRPLN
jgi:repressor LexA